MEYRTQNIEEKSVKEQQFMLILKLFVGNPYGQKFLIEKYVKQIPEVYNGI